MRHRHFSTPFSATPNDQHECNHLPPEQSYIPTGRSIAPENSSFVCPVDHTVRGGVHSNSLWTSEGRANEYPSSSLSMEMQHVAPSLSGPLYDPYPCSSVSGNLSLGSASNVGHVPSRYNRPPIRDVEGSMLNSTTSTGRGSFKRKSPDISGACERGIPSSRFSCPGSSSSSSQMLMEKPTVDCHGIPPGSIGFPPYRSTNLSIAGEDSVTNVRSRPRLELEPNMGRSHLLSYSSHHYHSTTRPANHSGQGQSANLNTDATSREWNCVPLYAPATQGRIMTPDIHVSSHEANQFLVGGTDAEIGGCHHENVFSRHSVSSSQYFQSPHAQAAREGRHHHSRRATPSYRNGPSYSHLGHGTASSTNGLHSPSESLSSRYSRHASAGGWRNSYRNGRPRISVERFQPITGVVDAHDRMGSEAMMMVDHAAFYGSSRNFLDQYRDMRLDIDSMSYEDLLALEERIGTVNTGLSEDRMSKCLIEKVHYSSDSSHEDSSCVICLEEYKNGEKVGTMKKCGHDFHVDCIKKWLLLKKVCPICKAECSS